jgi:hypothetical protein
MVTPPRKANVVCPLNFNWRQDGHYHSICADT